VEKFELICFLVIGSAVPKAHTSPLTRAVMRLRRKQGRTPMTMRPDPTFHASPKLAMEAPPENFAYTLLLSPDFSKPDALAVIERPLPRAEPGDGMAARHRRDAERCRGEVFPPCRLRFNVSGIRSRINKRAEPSLWDNLAPYIPIGKDIGSDVIAGRSWPLISASAPWFARSEPCVI
jgi:hypothetical protein